MVNWHIGCSGFYYKSWKGVFYPDKLPQREWLDYYCQHFGTLELNVTFYRFPQLSFLQNWYKRSPEDFRFAVKVPRLITHYKKFVDTGQLLADFYTTVGKGLQDKLKCVLFQLPPRIAYSEQLLEQILNAVDMGFTNVLEFRHPSWWRQDVYDALAGRKIIFCGMSHPSLPPEVIVNMPTVYYRMHGDTQLYGSSYSERQLEKLVADIQAKGGVDEAYIYFNNDMQGHAIQNASYLKKITS